MKTSDQVEKELSMSKSCGATSDFWNCIAECRVPFEELTALTKPRRKPRSHYNACQLFPVIIVKAEQQRAGENLS